MWHAGTEYTLESIKTMSLEDINKKVIDSFNQISQDIDIINGGEASAGIVSEMLHEKIPNITPLEEVSCRMTASSLTTSLPVFMQGTKSRTEREATISAVKYRNILRGNTPNNNNNQAYRPYASNISFGNI